MKINESNVGIEQAHPYDDQCLRLFNVETGKRSRTFSGIQHRDMFGILVPPMWAFREINVVIDAE